VLSDQLPVNSKEEETEEKDRKDGREPEERRQQTQDRMKTRRMERQEKQSQKPCFSTARPSSLLPTALAQGAEARQTENSYWQD
jgi:hypothetical protein